MSWGKLGEYVKTAVEYLGGIVGKLTDLLGGLSELTSFVSQVVAAIATLAAFKPRLDELAGKCEKAAGIVGVIWPHGKGELNDTAKGLRALGRVFTALNACATNPTEANMEAVEAAVKDEDLLQLKPTF